jgi:hypothetical protein
MVFDMLGRLAFTQRVGQMNSIDIPTEVFTAGAYQVVLNYVDGDQQRKALIVK